MIENLEIPSYEKLRSRRLKEVVLCGFRGCGEVAVASGVWREGKTTPLCEDHMVEAAGKSEDWVLTMGVPK